MSRLQPSGKGPAPRRLSRRALLGTASLGGVSLSGAALLACSRGNGPVSTSATKRPGAGKAPKRGGILIHAGGNAGSMDIRGVTFDPYRNEPSTGQSFSLFYERLLAYKLGTYTVEPELAQRWEQPSQTEYLFTLQPEVKWHDKPPVNGRSLVIDDARLSLERARTNDPRFLTRSLLTNVDRIEVRDKNTLRVTTKAPDVSTLAKLSVDSLAILAPEAVEKYPNMDQSEAAIGTGAFVAKSIAEGIGGEYTRNPAYWKPGLPYLDGLRTPNMADTLTAWASFQAKQADVIRLPGTAVKSYIAQQRAGFAPAWFRDQGFAYLIPNTSRKPMDDPRVTRALRLLIDHDEFITAWANVQYGQGAYGSCFPAALSSWDLTDEEYRQQLEWQQPKDEAATEAIALLAAAGFNAQSPLRFTLTVGANMPEYNAGAQLAQAQWKRLGKGALDVAIQIYQGNANNLLANRSFVYGLLGASALTEPDAWLSSYYHSGGSQNFSGLNDSNLDAMIDQQRAVFDEQQRKGLVKQIVLYLIDHGVSTVPSGRLFLNGVQTRVQGYSPEYWLNGRQYQSIWLSA